MPYVSDVVAEVGQGDRSPREGERGVQPGGEGHRPVPRRHEERHHGLRKRALVIFGRRGQISGVPGGRVLTHILEGPFSAASTPNLVNKTI